MKWFEKQKHTRVNRYSTVCRWKADTFFTGASIFCFQPWVVSGVVEPPENPLVIDQPCVRFGDVDNVGLGSGRHMTEFSMFGHHAFNSDREVYWKERTVELCHEWFKHLGVKEEEITYIEDWWEGGGNAGICFEVMVSGNEVATLVFMEYVVLEDEEYSEMKLKVVDTGYGLERMVWASHGTPTIYDAIYPDIIEFLKKEGKVKYNKEISTEFGKLSAALNIDEINVDEARKKIVSSVSKKLKLNESEVLEYIEKMHNVYQIADHTKALAFILGDGIVPSNLQEGYLARLLIRRTIRALESLGIKLSVSKIVEMHLKEIKSVYPDLWENRKDILKMVDFEENKYMENMKHIHQKVSGIENFMKSRGREKFTKSDFLLLYSSYGFVPEDVKKYLTMEIEDESKNITYNQIRHEITKTIEKEQNILKGKPEFKFKEFENLTETRKLYYENEKLFEFEATVLGITDNIVILDSSAFYPRGGGAEPDLGFIGNSEVIDVERQGNVIMHFVKEVDFNVGDVVECRVDENRRNRIRAHHTGAHVINGAARELLGNHVWQAGSKKDFDKAHLDVTHYTTLTEKEIETIEKRANEIISNAIETEKNILNRNEAESKFGFRIYQGGAVPGKMLRIINIPGFDVEACGGIHVDNTKEIGELLITKVERPQDGIVRFVFTCGKASEDFLNRRNEILQESIDILNSSESNFVSDVKKLGKEWKKKRKELEIEIKKSSDKFSKKDLEKVGKNRIIVKEIDNTSMIQLQEISKKLSDNDTVVVLFGVQDNINVLASSGKDTGVDVGRLVTGICLELGGNGGGRNNLAQGVGKKKYKLKEIIKKVKEELMK